MTPPHPAARTVLACLGAAGAARPITEVLTAARDHQITAYVGRALTDDGSAAGGGIETQAAAAWLRQVSAAEALSQLRALADLRWVAATLPAAGVPWFVMKGPVLSERVYPDPSLRSSRDLDVVVPARRFGDAIAALEAQGATLLDANWRVAIAQRRAQVHLRLPHGTTMDLHWHLLNAGAVRDTFRVAMPAVWQRLRTVGVADLRVATLSVTDTLVHLGLHAALAGAWRLRWLNDITLVIAGEPVEWDDVIARARDWRAARPLGVALLRARTLLHAQVPDRVLTALLGATARRTAERLDGRWSPLVAARGAAPARLWPQLVRDRWRDTARTVAWRLRRRAGNGLHGFGHGRDHPEMMTPSGGATGRARYLWLVEQDRLDLRRRRA